MTSSRQSSLPSPALAWLPGRPGFVSLVVGAPPLLDPDWRQAMAAGDPPTPADVAPLSPLLNR
jgi:hypothetical protein